MYAVVTYLCPGYALHFLAIGATFEAYEAVVYDCHDSMDLIANAVGVFLGYNLYNLRCA